MKKETKSKDAPKEHKQPWQEKDGDAIYSQAYALYQQGFQYWFSLAILLCTAQDWRWKSTVVNWLTRP